VLVGFGLAKAEDFRLGQYHGFGPVAAQPVWLQIIEVYVVFDFIGYWSHRVFHRSRWWPFHAVHHSSEDLDWLSSVRVHPVNDLGSKFCQVTPFLLLGFSPLVTFSAAPFFTFYALFLHAAVDWDLGPLRGVIASPVFHRWHHSKDAAAWDKNFAGLFVFWDRFLWDLLHADGSAAGKLWHPGGVSERFSRATRAAVRAVREKAAGAGTRADNSRGNGILVNCQGQHSDDRR